MKPLSYAMSHLRANIWMNMTGTLDVNDNTLIYGMEYDQSGSGLLINPERSCDLFIRYDRQTALREGAICPIEFFHYDGQVKWKPSGDPEKEYRLSEVCREDESAAIFAALETELASQLFESGVDHWKKNSKGKIIVVTHRQKQAEKYYRRLKEHGISTALAIDDNPKAGDEVKLFRDKTDPLALVTCMMAYEGLDVKSASHVICLTRIRSAPWIEQMLGRVWRSGKKKCWAFVPDDPRMNRVIAKIQQEQLQVISDIEIGKGPEGPPPNPKTIFALDGFVDEINRRFLDPNYSVDETEENVMEFVRSFGLNGDEEEVLALINRLRKAAIPKRNGSSVRQDEINLRLQIDTECKKNDAARARRRGTQPEWGETATELWSRTGKSIKHMSYEELKHACDILQNIRS